MENEVHLFCFYGPTNKNHHPKIVQETAQECKIENVLVSREAAAEREDMTNRVRECQFEFSSLL